MVKSAALAAVQNGAQDYLVKGHVNPNALSNSIRYARERKQLLESLRKYSASLEERNAELDAFAHTVAHDLKNQVFTVAGNAELLLDKQRILEIYLNNVAWGEGVFGAQAAARHYFRTDAARLDAASAARLAVMLPAPKRFEKNAGSAYVLGRAATISARMGGVELP